MTATATVRVARLPPSPPSVCPPHPRPLAAAVARDWCVWCVACACMCMCMLWCIRLPTYRWVLFVSCHPFGRSPFGWTDGWMDVSHIHTYMLIMLHTHCLTISLSHCPSFCAILPTNALYALQDRQGEVTHRPAGQQVGDGWMDVCVGSFVVVNQMSGAHIAQRHRRIARPSVALLAPSLSIHPSIHLSLPLHTCPRPAEPSLPCLCVVSCGVVPCPTH
mmetsp:Transcript_22238/g.54732  ORF Transcript_22238/g.54732 Transcript_22238/m.54732 type:complete len:219 (+) Transcript_22238:183-839(+)